MLFDNHIKLQTSQTLPFEVLTQPQFDNHKKSHTSQTIIDEISMCRSLTTI